MAFVETRYGFLQVPDYQNDLIGRFLEKYGEWAQHEIRFVAGALPDGARIADIGAFVGTFGLGVAALRPVEYLCFVEANPLTYPFLRENVARNASVPHAAIEAMVGPSDFVGSPSVLHDNAGTYSLVPSVGLAPDRSSADSGHNRLTLAQLRAEYGPFDLIKLDTEGMEQLILEDDAEFLRTTSAALWLECNETPISLDLFDFLQSLSFDVYYFASPAIAKQNFKGCEDLEFVYAYESGFWATRGAPPTLDEDLARAGCILERVTTREGLRQLLWETPRWAPASWNDLPHERLVATAVHAFRGEHYENYLQMNTPLLQPAPSEEAEAVAQARQSIEALTVELAAAREQLAEVTERARADEALRLEEATRTSEQLANSNEQLRACKVVLFQERERAAHSAQLLSKQIVEIRQETVDARQESAELRQEAAELRQEVVVLRRNIQAIYASTSWRATSPIRVIRRVLQRRPS